ncbi:MAG: class I tRNA ligase family protein [bacterium]|nr:class I tRNA ligase family protein [bacterium]
MFGDFKNLKLSEFEEEILEFWKKNKIFEKSVQKPKSSKLKAKSYIFYDGPPFATGTPHYGHIVASVIKDAVPRYWTMKGYRVERKWGWDCHGLPIENIAEKELGIKRKKEIEEMGIGKFNEFCRSKVLSYVDEWKKVIARLGRWADMENSYKTMDVSFMESVWWVFKQLWDKGLIYEGYRSIHICTRCETTLSQQEVSEGYKDIKDISATVKFELIDPIRTDGSKEPTSNGASEPKTQNLKPKTYILAWTTTPWTLIGNVALAVGNDIEYVKIREVGVAVISSDHAYPSPDNGVYIVAKDIFVKEEQKLVPGGNLSRRYIFYGKIYEILDDLKGSDLIGKKYKPLFEFYNSQEFENKENGWKIYGADFVTTDEGTGIVHIAPAFGEDDLNLGIKEKLPFIQHVGMDGIIKPEAKDFFGMSVKPMDDHQKTDVEIIKYLAKNNLLFAKEKYEHSYPHCWRCETPLINYATSSWFVNVLKIKDKALELAKEINWSPAHIKEGRFGKWLEGARDWSISRQRYWASAMPIWKCQDAEARGINAEQRGKNGCGAIKVIGSLEELKENIKKSGNRYFVMRHGEAEQNVKGILNSKLETNHYCLTEKGKKQVLAAAEILRQEKINLIFSSDLLRAKETSEMIADSLEISRDKIIFDKRIREVNFGIFDGKKSEEYRAYFSSHKERFEKIPPDGENFSQLKNRVSEFLYDIDKKYSNKNILIISHEAPILCMVAGAIGADIDKTLEITENKKEQFIKTGEFQKLDFSPLPHNDNYEIDLHRPYIDEIKFKCSCGGEMRRISDVLDTWFDSGSMPYAQVHYPFENKEKFEANFPAQFIAEGVDQTRSWFYYLHSIATAIKDSRAFDNVIVNGTVLAEDGKKMAKRLKNYPDPMEVINKYGADALRYYLLTSPVVAAENLNFSEKGVDEAHKKVIMRLWNVYKFYELYTSNIRVNPLLKNFNPRKSASILDKWILARLNILTSEITGAMDKYELNAASRPIGDFVEDLSNWYVRRSRERFTARGLTQTKRGLTQKELEQDKQAAILTTRFVLIEFSKIIAPFMPFMAETIYQQLKAKSSKLKAVYSVHLEEWPKFDKRLTTNDKRLLSQMKEVRKICSLGLEARQKAGIKVRQPLSKLKIKNKKLKINEDLLDLIKDELNIKEIIFDKNISSEIELDTTITAELKAEGQLRELIRMIQDLRKEAGYTPKDKINLWLEASKEIKNIINKHLKDFQEKIGAKTIEFRRNKDFDAESETNIDGKKIWLGIKKM